MTQPRLSEPPDRQWPVTELVRHAAIEVIPLKSVDAKLALIPADTTVTVTCSSKLGLDRTMDVSALAAAAGHHVVPHLAARQIPDAATLQGYLHRLESLGITDLYVVGGDAAEAVGPYASTAELVEALADLEHHLTNVGVACYPEGHPMISDETLLTALLRVQPHVDYMVSQVCFDHAAITDWLHRVRGEGVSLPLHLGLAAPLQIRKLVELSLRIGVGASLRFLTKQHGFVGNMLKGSAYRPEDLLYELTDTLTQPDLGVTGLHLFTFNQIAETLDWQATVVDP